MRWVKQLLSRQPRFDNLPPSMRELPFCIRARLQPCHKRAELTTGFTGCGKTHALLAVLAEFERDLLRERVRWGIAAARKRGVVFGRRPGQRVKADRFAPQVLKLAGEGQSYRGKHEPKTSQN
jgi:hypothetical protein